jgi:hypothetical protein
MTRKLLPALLVLITAYSLFVYYDSLIHLQYTSMDELGNETFVEEYHNPLREIFAGSEATGQEGSWRTYHPLNRLGTLLQTVMLILLVSFVVRWFVRKEWNHTWLVFTLLTLFWIKVSHLMITLIGQSVHVLNAQSLMPFFRTDVAWYWIPLMVLYLLVTGAALKGLLAGQSLSGTAVPAGALHSFQGMRAVHMVVDRTLLLLLGSQYFLLSFFQATVSSSRMYSQGFDPVYYQLLGSLHWMLASLLAYFLTERLFGMTPGKVLTGLRVARSADNESAGTGSIAGRTLSRLIPFENFSVLTHRMWHDSISGTQLVYASSSPWLARQSRVVSVCATIMLVFSVWVVLGLITTIIGVDSMGNTELWEDHGQLAYIVVFGGFIPCWFMFAGYISALANGADNLVSEEHRDRGAFVFETWAWLIPFAHFILPGRTLYTLRENLTLKYPDHPGLDALRRAERTFKVLFHIFYVLLVLALIAVLSDRSVYGLISAGVISTPGFICLFSGMLVYARAVKRLGL